MSVRTRRRALILLLAALALPAWATAHAAVHAHLAEHHGGATHSETPASAPDEHPSETRQIAARESHDHDHEHEHLVGLFVRPTGSTDLGSPAALPLTTPCAEAAPRLRWQLHLEAAAPLARREAVGSSGPRAPPAA
jgi:hypothetical protein